jgi:hypothetical protein
VGESTARVVFDENSVPRLAVLKDAFADRQLHVEVRRPQPLSLVLNKGGAEPLMETLTEALALLATPDAKPLLTA